jgi:hypothetical protein
MTIESNKKNFMPQFHELSNIRDTGEFNSGKGYVELTLKQSLKDKCKNLVAQTFTTDQFYYAEKLPHIAGNVANEMHITLYYGFGKDDKLNKLNVLQKSNLLNLLQVKEVCFRWNELHNYYVVMLIYKKNVGLNGVYSLLKNLDSIPNHNHVFRPHSTIAYVKGDISEKILQEKCHAIYNQLEINFGIVHSLKYAEFDANIMEFNF